MAASSALTGPVNLNHLHEQLAFLRVRVQEETAHVKQNGIPSPCLPHYHQALTNIGERIVAEEFRLLGIPMAPLPSAVDPPVSLLLPAAPPVVVQTGVGDPPVPHGAHREQQHAIAAATDPQIIQQQSGENNLGAFGTDSRNSPQLRPGGDTSSRVLPYQQQGDPRTHQHNNELESVQRGGNQMLLPQPSSSGGHLRPHGGGQYHVGSTENESVVGRLLGSEPPNRHCSRGKRSRSPTWHSTSTSQSAAPLTRPSTRPTTTAPLLHPCLASGGCRWGPGCPFALMDRNICIRDICTPAHIHEDRRTLCKKDRWVEGGCKKIHLTLNYQLSNHRRAEADLTASVCYNCGMVQKLDALDRSTTKAGVYRHRCKIGVKYGCQQEIPSQPLPETQAAPLVIVGPVGSALQTSTTSTLSAGCTIEEAVVKPE